MFKNDRYYNKYLTALKSAPFFKDSSEESIHQLLSFCKHEQWKVKTFKNSTEVLSTFYFIVSGRLKIYKSNPETGREHTVFVLSGGDVFDVLSLLDSKSHDVYWKALDNLEVLKMSMDQMRNWIS
jgi:CRP/FNR family cyclic AMP-dependent transcriptional regulator